MNLASPNVLILGSSREGLGVIRTLASNGFRVFCGIEAHHDVIRFSSKLSGCWNHPSLQKGNQHELAESISAAAEKLEGDAVWLFPVGETAILRALQLKDRLPQRVRVVTTNEEAIHTCVDKSKARELFSKLGLPQPETHFVQTRWELGEALECVKLPAVIKPAVSGGWRSHQKAVIINHPEEPETLLSFWNEESPLIVQSRLRGARHNVYFAARNGKILARLEAEILRTDRRDGTGLAVEGHILTEPTESMIANCDAIVEALNYNGVGCLQFLVDPETREATVLELNPRLGANYAVVDAAGLNLALIALELVRNPDSVEQLLPEKFGAGRYAWISGDLAGLGVQLRRGLGLGSALAWFGRILSSLVLAKHHVTWSFRDPLPTLKFLTHLALKASPSRASSPSAAAVPNLKNGNHEKLNP
ncbi:MAG: ATP-grasp domain-containing protein [Verrucomicrobiota bacterium]